MNRGTTTTKMSDKMSISANEVLFISAPNLFLACLVLGGFCCKSVFIKVS
jgi:hypothetical protein